MDKARPIEAGCMAVVIEYNSEFFGAIVTVIGRNSDYSVAEDTGEWEVDLPLIAGDGRDAPSGSWTADSNQLLRIDDPSIQNEIESERELVHVR